MPKREVLSFDKGWKFHLGDVPFPVIKGHNATYTSTKAGRATGAADPAYDDSGWRCVDLPHDWVIEMPFDQDENLSQGYKNGDTVGIDASSNLIRRIGGKHWSYSWMV